jgi:hypothetical protein
VLDQGSGTRRQVIVRTGAPGEETDRREALLAIASDALKQRNMALSARECLPPALSNRRRSTVKGLDSRLERYASDPTKSLASSVERRHVTAPARSRLKEQSEGGLGDFRAHDIIKKAFRETPDRKRRTSVHVQPSFWTSKAMLLDVSTTDLQALANEPLVRDIYPNRLLRTPRLVQAKALPDTVIESRAASWGLSRINALAAWGAYGARGDGVRIGILDTGIDADHPDLKGKVVAWAEFDADGNRVRSKPHDSDKHGTHCAGTLVGGASSGQWIGVAPDAELAVALVLNGEQGGTDAQILAGIDWLVEQNVEVISMSLGGLTLDNETPNTYTEAVITCLRAGIPVVTAIGNDGSQTTGSPGNDIFAFAVGATDYRDRAAGFSGGRTHIIRESNFIPEELLPLPYSKPEVSAPGVAIFSSVPGGTWDAFNGSSMATPHVAGAIALVLSATAIRDRVPEAQRAFVLQDLLTGAAEELGESGQNHRFGFGRIDVLRAIGFAIERGYGTPLGMVPSKRTARGNKKR